VRVYDGKWEVVAMTGKTQTPGQIADIIGRFLSVAGLYPQEFNDFFECSLSDPKLDAHRQRCEMLHSEFEPRRGHLILLSLDDLQHQAQREAAATGELEQIVAELRLLERTHDSQAKG
jgi:hypothetical protein